VDKVVLVDKNDKPLGLRDKTECHLGKGILHRAFSVFVFNKDRVLLQQRSSEKFLWPLYWTNTCCSHPLPEESYKQAAQRRLKEEMGFVCAVQKIGAFQYQASYKDKGSENEVCAVLRGEYNGEVSADPKEVAAWKWVDFKELKKDVKLSPGKYTPWFKMEIDKFFS